jgi:hypothetical protein
LKRIRHFSTFTLAKDHSGVKFGGV